MDATLNLWRRSTFVWGQTDCIMSVANYIRDVTGSDPAAEWRGTYDDEAGALAITDRYGGPLGLCSYGAGLAGMKPLQQPLRGAVVVCQIGPKEIAGLCLGDRTVFMALRGCVEFRAKVLAAWAV